MLSSSSRAATARRLVAAFVGLLGFVAAAWLFSSGRDFLGTAWFFLGVATAASVIFVEPHYSKGADAVINGLAAIAFYFGMDHDPVPGLWDLYFAYGAVLVLAGAAAQLSPRASGLNAIGRAIAATFGRAVRVGGIGLGLVVLAAAADGSERVNTLAIGIALLLLSLTADWVALLASVRAGSPTADVVAVHGPNVLLLNGLAPEIARGARLRLIRGASESWVTVVRLLRHRDGLRHMAVADGSWSSFTSGLPAAVMVDVAGSGSDIVGAASAGSSERDIAFEPLRRMEIGEAVVIQTEGRSLVYQVSRQVLADNDWGGALTLTARSTASLVGTPSDGWLETSDYLPDPHQLLQSGSGVIGTLPAGFVRLGVVKGTEIPIGYRIDGERRGHLAILGMSGMGKTTVTTRLSDALGADALVIAVDTTGEYRTNLGFSPWTPTDFMTTGAWVYEPTGEVAVKTKEFVHECMAAGDVEYRAGNPPAVRVVVLEEAHGLIPEWNFATSSAAKDAANVTARYILQARKFGLSFVFVSQRTAVVSKSALTQCENFIVFKSIDNTSSEFLAPLIGEAFARSLGDLKRGEAVCCGPAFNTDGPVVVRMDPS